MFAERNARPNPLLPMAASPTPATGALTTRSAPALKAKVTRGDVLASMRPVHARVAQCASSHQIVGLVKVRIVIQPGGEVTSAVPDRGGDVFAGCILSVVRQAHFPAARAGRTIQYPFKFASNSQTDSAPAASLADATGTPVSSRLDGQ